MRMSLNACPIEKLFRTIKPGFMKKRFVISLYESTTGTEISLSRRENVTLAEKRS